MAQTPIETLTAQLLERADLRADQAAEAAGILASPETDDAAKVAFLEALAAKGETAAEVAAFAKAFLERAVDPGVGARAREAIDVVGTGGDHAGGFNVSSLVVLTLACAGVTVMKHGNRGITSKCGSADLLAALGVDLEAPPQKQRRALDELGYAFFFAPAYHPAFRQVAGARKALAARGQRSIFNILGPMINPGRPGRSLIGVFSEVWVGRLAGALEVLGCEAGVVGHGVIGPGRGIDEVTTATSNRYQGVGRLGAQSGTWVAGDFGLAASPIGDLQGGDLEFNLARVEALLAGRGPAGLADTIALNASLGLWICGRTARPSDGIAQARELLTGGAVAAKIAATREFYRS